MKQVLYKAKRKDTLEWIEGYYVKVRDVCSSSGEDVHLIISTDAEMYCIGEIGGMYRIHPETLCQLIPHPVYDSFQDNPNIFENDILAVWKNRRADIEHTEPDCYALPLDEFYITPNGRSHWYTQDTTRVKVVGNMFDNPELFDHWNLHHFKCDCGECPEDYSDRHEHITKTYDIHGAHAGCYLCNFGSEYMCKFFGGGCPDYEICKRIQDKEELSDIYGKHYG